METSYKSLLNKDFVIPEEMDDPPSKSATDTVMSKADTSQRDFIQDMEKEEAMRRTVRFSDDAEYVMRPRADQVMQDLELDLSEGRTATEDTGTENRSRIEDNAIYEENSAQTVTTTGDDERPRPLTHVPTPEGHEAPLYNDFLQKQQTQVAKAGTVIDVEKLHKMKVAASLEDPDLSAIEND